MNNKIGIRELEIMEYLQEKKEVAYAQVVAEFSPTMRSRGKTYVQYSVAEQRLLRMQKKGFVVIEKKGSARVVRSRV